MIQSKTVKNVGIFIILFLMIFTLNPCNLNSGFSLITFAQETEQTGETGETAGTEETQESPVIEETGGTKEAKEEETEKAKSKEETEEENLSLNADSINYDRVDGEDIIIAQNNAKLKYQDIEINSDYLKVNLTTHLLFASGNVYFKQNETETFCEELSYNWKSEKT
ncbi:MAG: hypothetical protein U9N03_03880, partial [Candidatus Caldatribacteriota bacterium]|nr:hypothetical protein [Candidatus Caldatribacteriota bacterium]